MNVGEEFYKYLIDGSQDPFYDREMYFVGQAQSIRRIVLTGSFNEKVTVEMNLSATGKGLLVLISGLANCAQPTAFREAQGPGHARHCMSVAVFARQCQGEAAESETMTYWPTV